MSDNMRIKKENLEALMLMTYFFVLATLIVGAAIINDLLSIVDLSNTNTPGMIVVGGLASVIIFNRIISTRFRGFKNKVCSEYYNKMLWDLYFLVVLSLFLAVGFGYYHFWL